MVTVQDPMGSLPTLTKRTSNSFINLGNLPNDRPLLYKVKAMSKEDSVIAESASVDFSCE